MTSALTIPQQIRLKAALSPDGVTLHMSQKDALRLAHNLERLDHHINTANEAIARTQVIAARSQRVDKLHDRLLAVVLSAILTAQAAVFWEAVIYPFMPARCELPAEVIDTTVEAPDER